LDTSRSEVLVNFLKKKIVYLRLYPLLYQKERGCDDFRIKDQPLQAFNFHDSLKSNL